MIERSIIVFEGHTAGEGVWLAFVPGRDSDHRFPTARRLRPAPVDWWRATDRELADYWARAEPNVAPYGGERLRVLEAQLDRLCQTGPYFARGPAERSHFDEAQISILDAEREQLLRELAVTRSKLEAMGMIVQSVGALSVTEQG